MDIESLFNTNTILQSLTVGILVYMVRIWSEAKWEKLATNKLYTGVALPTLALLVSLLISFLIPFGPVVGFAEKLSSGLICGFASSYLFSAMKGILRKEGGES